jgi:hypothetical protein
LFDAKTRECCESKGTARETVVYLNGHTLIADQNSLILMIKMVARDSHGEPWYVVMIFDVEGGFCS